MKAGISQCSVANHADTLCAFFCLSWLVTEEPITALDWASGSFSSLLGLLGVRNTKRAIAPKKITVFCTFLPSKVISAHNYS